MIHSNFRLWLCSLLKCCPSPVKVTGFCFTVNAPSTVQLPIRAASRVRSAPYRQHRPIFSALYTPSRQEHRFE